MAREFSRSDRIAAQLQRELAKLIQQELRDPSLGMITVAAVRVTRDMAHAKVFITLLGQRKTVPEVLTVMHEAAPYLRHRLAQRVLMRIVPELHFVFDESVERGSRLSRLIDEAVAHGHPAPTDD